MTHSYKKQAHDTQAPLSGKSDNTFNKQGLEKPTQKNEGRRTPHSRGDRDDHLGNNQTQARQNVPGPKQGQAGRK